MPNPRAMIAADGPAAEVYRISPEEPWRVIRTRWRIAGLATAISTGADTVTAEVDGQRFQLSLALSPNERAVLTSGGLIAHIRAGGRSRVPVA